MTSERWQQVKQLFHDALEVEEGQRPAFLERACAQDAWLREQVEQLLAHDGEAVGFLEAPAFAAAQVQEDGGGEGLAADQRVGPYRLVREIGRGGMGVVYLAERDDGEYRHQVALKLIKRGMDSDEILRRFRYERQILANLNHPNIARLLEGGTTEDGRPYFVMEYVEGQPIDRYCDEHRLSTTERLRLFLTVCAAVRHAHQNLVVHRDIKPGNILVTAEGEPKLLDFGIAKLLAAGDRAQAAASQTGRRAMTPAYASPEQVRGDAITTVSDVYSLGVLLYELLTGRRPYRVSGDTPPAVERAITDEEPERPSLAVGRVEPAADGDGPVAARTAESLSAVREGSPERLRRRLAGDLDAILLTALRKEPERRYASVEQFSEDIRRHLDGLAVAARRDTLGYRTTRSIRRHKAGVVAAGLVVATLLGGMATTLWQARAARAQRAAAEAQRVLAETQRAKAERRFNDVRKLANTFIFDFYSDAGKLPGSLALRERMVKTALEYLDNLAKDAGDDPALQGELASAYERVGNVQGWSSSGGNLGNLSEALENYRKALAIREALVAANSKDAQARYELGKSYRRFGNMLGWAGDLTQAVDAYKKSLAVHESLIAASPPPDVELQRGLAATTNFLALELWRLGKTEEALRSYRRNLAIYQVLLAANPADTQIRRALAQTHNRLGEILLETEDLAGALEHHREALALGEALSVKEPPKAETSRSLAASYAQFATTLVKGGDRAGALAACQKALALLGPWSETGLNPSSASALALTYGGIGSALTKVGDTSTALKLHRRALAIHQTVAAADLMNATYRRQVGRSHRDIGQALEQAGDRAGAERHYRRNLAILEPLAAADAANGQLQFNLSFQYHYLGSLQIRRGNPAGALKTLHAAVALREKWAEINPGPLFQSYLADSCSKLGEAYAALASNARVPIDQRLEYGRSARSWYQRGLDLFHDARQRKPLGLDYAGAPEELAETVTKGRAVLQDLEARAAASRHKGSR